MRQRSFWLRSALGALLSLATSGAWLLACDPSLGPKTCAPGKAVCAVGYLCDPDSSTCIPSTQPDGGPQEKIPADSGPDATPEGNKPDDATPEGSKDTTKPDKTPDATPQTYYLQDEFNPSGSTPEPLINSIWSVVPTPRQEGTDKLRAQVFLKSDQTNGFVEMETLKDCLTGLVSNKPHDLGKPWQLDIRVKLPPIDPQATCISFSVDLTPSANIKTDVQCYKQRDSNMSIRLYAGTGCFTKLAKGSHDTQQKLWATLFTTAGQLKRQIPLHRDLQSLNKGDDWYALSLQVSGSAVKFKINGAPFSTQLIDPVPKLAISYVQLLAQDIDGSSRKVSVDYLRLGPLQP